MGGKTGSGPSGSHDFFEAQAIARRRLREVDFGFGLAVLAGPTLWSLVAVGLIGLSWTVALAVAVLWALVMLVPAWLAVSRSVEGGDQVARATGAYPVHPPSADPAAQRLYELVEDMALATGIAVPDVYLLPRDDSINAMVAGRGPADAALVVTRGAAERLDRRQLQALVAHEIDHIQSGDMLVNLRVVGWASGLAALHDAGAALWRTASRSYRDTTARFPMLWRGMMLAVLWVFLPVFAVAALMRVVGSFGKLLGTSLQAAACRHHESSADAAAARMVGDAAPPRDLLLMAAGSSAASAQKVASRDIRRFPLSAPLDLAARPYHHARSGAGREERSADSGTLSKRGADRAVPAGGQTMLDASAYTVSPIAPSHRCCSLLQSPCSSILSWPPPCDG